MKKLLASVTIVAICAIFVFIVINNKEKNEIIPPDTNEQVEITPEIKPEIEENIKPNDYNDKTFIEFQNFYEETKENDTVIISADYILPKANDYANIEFKTNFNDFYKKKNNKIIDYLNYEGYDNALLSYESQENFLPYSYELFSIVSYENKELVSILREEMKTEGGPHPNSYVYGETFNKTDGTLLLLSDILNDNDFIVPYIKEHFIKGNEDYFYENVNELLDELFSTQNYYLTKTGIIIYYNAYDLAPYAYGIPKFELKYTDINEYLLYQNLGE